MMKSKPIFSKFNLTLVALMAALAAMLVFTGCASGGDSDHAGHSANQSSCH